MCHCKLIAMSAVAKVALCISTLATLEGAALAQEEPSPAPLTVSDPEDCLDDEKCSQLYGSARRLSQAGHYEAALVNYQLAYAQKPTPWLLINIGRMQQKIGKPQQAIASFKRFLDDNGAQASEDPESHSKAREYLGQAEKELAAEKQRAFVHAPPPAPPLHPPPALLAAAARPQLLPPPQLIRRWWLWTTVSGAAAGLAIGLGVGLSQRPTSVAAVTIPAGEPVYAPTF